MSLAPISVQRTSIFLPSTATALSHNEMHGRDLLNRLAGRRAGSHQRLGSAPADADWIDRDRGQRWLLEPRRLDVVEADKPDVAPDHESRVPHRRCHAECNDVVVGEYADR